MKRIRPVTILDLHSVTEKRIIDEMDVLEQEMIQEALECTPWHSVDDPNACKKAFRVPQLAVDAATSTAAFRELGRARQRRPA